jgi:hypothetical protein
VTFPRTEAEILAAAKEPAAQRQRLYTAFTFSWCPADEIALVAVGRVLEHRAVQVDAAGAGKRPRTAAGLDEAGPVNCSAIFKASGKLSSA